MAESVKREIIYVGDPMCSWCWGFSPVLRELRRRYGGQAPLSVVVGGLRPGTTEILTDEMRDYIHHHWQEVNERTGQPFGSNILEQAGFVYDTEPSCRAVVAVRRLNPEHVFDFFEELHRAFYRDGKDITQENVLTDLATKVGADGSEFSKEFISGETVDETLADFQQARELGINGFPSVVLKDGGRHTLLTRGYQPFEALRPHIDSWLENTRS